jgi:hypothetical protein
MPCMAVLRRLTRCITFQQVGTSFDTITAGMQCVNPFDTGDFPTCDPDQTIGDLKVTGLKDPRNNDTKIKYEPTYAHYLTKPDGTPRLTPEIVLLQNGGYAPCEISTGADTVDYCSPWTQTYGFFFGDGTSTDVLLTITRVRRPSPPVAPSECEKVTELSLHALCAVKLACCGCLLFSAQLGFLSSGSESEESEPSTLFRHPAPAAQTEHMRS